MEHDVDPGPADDPTAAGGEEQPLDPRTADPRVMMRELLPAARREYVRAWEWLADPATPHERRRLGRERAGAIAADHAIVAAALREREPHLHGDDLLNARHLADELERHAAALERVSRISPHGLRTTADLRPEALGCGTRYRDPARTAGPGTSTRPVASRSVRGERPRGRGASGGGGNPPRSR